MRSRDDNEVWMPSSLVQSSLLNTREGRCASIQKGNKITCHVFTFLVFGDCEKIEAELVQAHMPLSD